MYGENPTTISDFINSKILNSPDKQIEFIIEDVKVSDVYKQGMVGMMSVLVSGVIKSTKVSTGEVTQEPFNQSFLLELKFNSQSRLTARYKITDIYDIENAEAWVNGIYKYDYFDLHRPTPTINPLEESKRYLTQVKKNHKFKSYLNSKLDLRDIVLPSVIENNTGSFEVLGSNIKLDSAIQTNVLFHENEDRIIPESLEEFDSICNLLYHLSSATELIIEIEGYTSEDLSGKKYLEMKELSEKRAQKIKLYMLDKNIQAKFIIHGNGSTNFIEGIPKSDKRNRRVEIVIRKK